MYTAAIIEDTKAVRDALISRLKTLGFDVMAFDDVPPFKKFLANRNVPPNLLISDLYDSCKSRFSTSLVEDAKTVEHRIADLKELRAKYPDVHILVFSSLKNLIKRHSVGQPSSSLIKLEQLLGKLEAIGIPDEDVIAKYGSSGAGTTTGFRELTKAIQRHFQGVPTSEEV